MDAKSVQITHTNQIQPAFKSPAEFLSALAPETAADLLSVAADVALVVESGIIKDVAIGGKALIEEGFAKVWPGTAWVDTVTIESRPKIEDLLNQAPGKPIWRQVNHPSKSGLDVPIKYAVISAGSDDRFIVIGRDLSGMAALQQRLINAHQDLERDYSRMRRAEGRYRLLFNASTTAILIINSNSGIIEETNSAAERLTQLSAKQMTGQPITNLFGPERSTEISEFLASVASGNSKSLSSVPLNIGGSVDLSASVMREEQGTRLVLHLSETGTSANDNNQNQTLISVLNDLPDGLVLADSDQRILSVNGTFANLAQLSSNQEARGQHLQSFLGRSATDLNVLFSALNKNGSIRNFATVSRDRFGAEDKVEVSAVTAPSSEGVVYAFAIRSVSRRLTQSPRLDEQLPTSSSDFTELVGRVPLKDIIKESTMLIEKLCIEAALDISDNNRASAAEMLGLSRQGLYSKLKRNGLDNNN